MQIVIDISEKDYKSLKHGHIPLSMLNVIKNGTLLPRHGRLIDADLLRNQFPIWIDNFSSYVVNNTISKTPTILEADNGESEVSDAT